MKKIYVLVSFLLLAGCATEAQFLKDARKILKTATSGILTEGDAAAGIREALEKGTNESVKLVSVLDGYWKNPEIKIPFPPEAQNVESKLRAIGLGNKVDQFNESMNRAAEKAAEKAAPVFVSAIRSMTVKDAVNIVKGEKNAATMYLKNTTTPQLTTEFSPIINSALESVYATKYWSDLITAYNKLPLVKKMNPDLTAYVTGKAIDGLFIMIEKEELKIRTDPAARTTELLRKVFGK